VQKRPLHSASTVYIGNKKDHCSQLSKSRHQMCRPPSSGRVRWQACGLPYPASGRRSRPYVALHVCFLTGAPQRRRPSRCLPFHAPIPPASSGVRRGRGGGDFPACRPGADGHCGSLVMLPRTPLPGRFGHVTADYVDRPQAALGSRHRPAWERRRVRPVIAPPPFAPRRRSNSNHAGKSSYSAEIDYRFLTFQTGSLF